MNSFFRTDIGALRGLAIIFVVLAHARTPYFSGGFIGVDIFFVISGYLITGILIKELKSTNKVSFLNFYCRRIKRLLPALIAMLVLVSIASVLLLSPHEQLGQAESASASALWISNLYFAVQEYGYFDKSSETFLFLHTWSLGVEEQFYLIWPLLLVLIFDRYFTSYKNTRIKFIAACLLSVFVVGLAFSLYVTYTDQAWAFYSMPTRAWQFATGALVWVTLTSPREFRFMENVSNWRTEISCSGMSLITISIFVVEKSAYPGYWALLPTFGTALVLLAGSTIPEEKNGLEWFFELRSLQWIGKISYSWYLWHWPVFVFGFLLFEDQSLLGVCLLISVSLGLASISYYCIEAPVRYTNLFSTKQFVILSSAIVVSLVAYSSANQWFAIAKTWSDSSGQHRFVKMRSLSKIYYQDECDDWIHSSTLKPCHYGNPAANKRAVLLGDSIGVQWFPAIEKLYLKKGWKVTVLTKSSCPIIDEIFNYARLGREFTECNEWRAKALKWITNKKPDVLIYGNSGTVFGKSAWINGTKRILAQIADHVTDLYIVTPTYALGFDAPDCLARQDWQTKTIGSVNDCTQSVNSDRIDSISRWLMEASNGFQNVRIIDMNELVCPHRVCSSERDGEVIFRDNHHISPSFAESLSDDLERKLYTD